MTLAGDFQQWFIVKDVQSQIVSAVYSSSVHYLYKYIEIQLIYKGVTPD